MPIQFHHEEEDLYAENSSLRCRRCGAEDFIEAEWSETVCGTAHILNHDIELDNYEDGDSQDFEIHQFICLECDLRGNNLYDVALRVGEEFVEPEEA